MRVAQKVFVVVESLVSVPPSIGALVPVGSLVVVPVVAFFLQTLLAISKPFAHSSHTV